MGSLLFRVHRGGSCAEEKDAVRNPSGNRPLASHTLDLWLECLEIPGPAGGFSALKKLKGQCYLGTTRQKLISLLDLIGSHFVSSHISSL